MVTILTQEVLSSCNKKVYASALKRISEIVYVYPGKKYGWDEEMCSEFYSFFLPTIKRIMKNFTYIGKPFEAYLFKYMNFNIKTFFHKYQKKQKMQFYLNSKFLNCTESRYAEISATHTYNVCEQGKNFLGYTQSGGISCKHAKKKLLILALKNYARIGNDMIPALADTIGISEKELNEYFTSLSELSRHKLDRKKRLSQRRNLQLKRLIDMQKNLKKEMDENKKKTIYQKLEGHKKVMCKTLHELSHVVIDPTHNDIATVLKIPKGTVDSVLFNMREKAKKYF